MSDVPAQMRSMAPGGPAFEQLIVGALNALVQATNAQAQVIKGNLNAPASGDLSGIYPGPISVVSTHLAAPLPTGQGGTGNTTGQPAGAATGDLAGVYPNPTVAKINGATLGVTTATAGNLLIAAAGAWSSQTLSGDATLSGGGVITIGANAISTAKIAAAAVTYAKLQNESAHTILGNPTGVGAAPSEVSLGATLAFSGTALQTAALTGDVTAAANSFATTVAKINGQALGTTTPSAGNLLIGSGAQWATQAITGDATLTSAGILTVTQINGVALGTTTATAGNLLIGSGAQWVTHAISGDATLSSTGAMTVTKTGGASFTSYATASQGQLVGTATNDSATAGNIGEEIESVVASGAPISLVSTTPKSVTSLIITAGDWDVWAYIGFNGGATTTVNYLIGSISATNNTLDQTRTRWGSEVPAGATVFNTLANTQFAAGQDRFSVAGNTTIYLVAQASFGTSTCAAFGTIIARRRR